MAKTVPLLNHKFSKDDVFYGKNEILDLVQINVYRTFTIPSNGHVARYGYKKRGWERRKKDDSFRLFFKNKKVYGSFNGFRKFGWK